MHVTMEHSDITPYISIGTNMCCSMHGDRLVKLGFDADLDLEEERQEAPPAINFYTWIPIPNHVAPSQDQLDFGVAVIRELVALRKKVYVHCHNGHGRAPTIVATYLTTTGKTTEEALQMIAAKRPEVHLEDVQRQALDEFYRRQHDHV